MVIYTDSAGKELGVLPYSEYDFEIGDDVSDFMITMNTTEYVPIPTNGRLFIPGTEYGGIYKRMEADSAHGTVGVGGYSWRGMLRNKVICPESGADYAVDSGDINTILNDRLSSAFGGLFCGAGPIGVSVTYKYNRYVTLYDGLVAMLESVGYKMRIQYDQTLRKVVIDAVPIVDYSDKIEFSSDMRANYYAYADNAGVNHLICLGSGQLRNRTVVHLYTNAKGKISQTQTYYGADEIAHVYDYAGADEAQLIQSGTQQLKTLQTVNKFSLDVEGLEPEIGDIVGGKDYVTGMTMKAPIVGKIHKSEKGLEETEYTISDNVEVTI